MALNYAGFINATSRWSRNRIYQAGKLIAHMVSISLPKAVAILPSSGTKRSRKKTSTTADATAGTNFTAKDLEDFWYNSEDA